MAILLTLRRMCLAVVALCCLFTIDTSVAMTTGHADQNRRAADHHLVRYTVTTSAFVEMIHKHDAEVDRIWDIIGVARVSGLTPEALDDLHCMSGIRTVQQDIDVKWIDDFTPGRSVAVQYAFDAGAAIPAEPAFASIQWNIEQIAAGVPERIAAHGHPVRVGLLSTGISPQHIDLRNHFDLGASVNLSSSNPADRSDYLDRHMQGTILSALIVSNGVGVASITSDATVVGIKVLNDDGRATVANLIDGVMYAADEARVDIINLGIDHEGLGLMDKELAEILGMAVRHATERGVLVVAGVGDCDANASSFVLTQSLQAAGALLIGPSLPAEGEDCGAVACYAETTTSVKLYAPGGDRDCSDGSFRSISDMVISALSPEVAKARGYPQPDTWYVFSSSPGIASAHVTGVAALMKSRQPTAGPTALVDRLLHSARQPAASSRQGELHARYATSFNR